MSFLIAYNVRVYGVVATLKATQISINSKFYKNENKII